MPSGFENGFSSRGRMLDPLTLEELPVDTTAWIVLDSAAYSPRSVRMMVEAWEDATDVLPEGRAESATFRCWTRGYAGRGGAFTMQNPLRQGVALSTTALRTIHTVLSERERGRSRRVAGARSGQTYV